MQHNLYVITAFIHILSATLWVGGMLFMTLMLVPALRDLKNPPLMSELMKGVGRRYHGWGWGTLGVSLITGLALLSMRGITHAQLGSPDFWRTSFGTTLAWKLGIFASMAAISLLHDILAIRSAAQINRSHEKALQARRIASWLGRITLVLSLALVLLGVMLVRGNPWA